MAKALAAIESGKLQNIRLHFDDAVNLIAWLPESSLARIDLIHPDPWPKRRHWKRRFVQDAMVSRLARILRPGGEFRFVTDIADYAAWTLQRLLRSADFEWTAQCADDWRKPWPGFIHTRYHAKAAREERASCFLVFREDLARRQTNRPAGLARSVPPAAPSRSKAVHNWRRRNRAHARGAFAHRAAA